MARSAEPDPLDRCMPTPSRIAAGRRSRTDERTRRCRRQRRPSRPLPVPASTARPLPGRRRHRSCAPRGSRASSSPSRRITWPTARARAPSVPGVRAQMEVGVARRCGCGRDRPRRAGHRCPCRARRISSHVWIDVRDGIHPPDHDRLALGRSSGSGPRPAGRCAARANPCGPQIERSSRVAPSRLNQRLGGPERVEHPHRSEVRVAEDRLDRRGRRPALPTGRRSRRCASSQPMGSNSPLPLVARAPSGVEHPVRAVHPLEVAVDLDAEMAARDRVAWRPP